MARAVTEAMLRLNRVVKELGAAYGAIAVTTLEPFEYILLENAAYLVDDHRRWRTFQTLREKIGVTPEAILRRNVPDLAGIIAEGGMKPEMRAEKLLECVRLAMAIGVDRLNAAVRHREPGAKRLLRQFPGVGEPYADRILLLAGGEPGLAPDSNALRVLTRLGYIREQKTFELAVEETRSPSESTPASAQRILKVRSSLLPWNRKRSKVRKERLP